MFCQWGKPEQGDPWSKRCFASDGKPDILRHIIDADERDRADSHDRWKRQVDVTGDDDHRQRQGDDAEKRNRRHE